MASIFHSPRHWQCCKFGDELYVNLELCHKINGSQSFQQDIVKPLGWLADTLNNESPPHPLLLKPRPVQSYVFFFFLSDQHYEITAHGFVLHGSPDVTKLCKRLSTPHAVASLVLLLGSGWFITCVFFTTTEGGDFVEEYPPETNLWIARTPPVERAKSIALLLREPILCWYLCPKACIGSYDLLLLVLFLQTTQVNVRAWNVN